jgi:hypothetical protein
VLVFPSRFCSRILAQIGFKALHFVYKMKIGDDSKRGIERVTARPSRIPVPQNACRLLEIDRGRIQLSRVATHHRRANRLRPNRRSLWSQVRGFRQFPVCMSKVCSPPGPIYGRTKFTIRTVLKRASRHGRATQLCCCDQPFSPFIYHSRDITNVRCIVVQYLCNIAHFREFRSKDATD